MSCLVHLDALSEAVTASRIIVGVAGDSGCGPASNDQGDCADVGAVSVFEKTSRGWAHVQQLKAAQGATSEGFGSSVALEGNTLAIGAPGHRGCLTGVGEQSPYDTCSIAGAVYLYEQVSGRWRERQTLLISKERLPAFNGRQVQLSQGTLIVANPSGGHCPSIQNCSQGGIVQTFTRGANGWAPSSTLVGSAGASGFGVKVAAKSQAIAVTARVTKKTPVVSGPAEATGVGGATMELPYRVGA